MAARECKQKCLVNRATNKKELISIEYITEIDIFCVLFNGNFLDVQNIIRNNKKKAFHEAWKWALTVKLLTSVKQGERIFHTGLRARKNQFKWESYTSVTVICHHRNEAYTNGEDM